MKKLILLIFTLTPFISGAQSDVTFNGYIKDLYMYYQPDKNSFTDDNNLTTNTIHNRLNIKWYTSDQITTVIEMRNRILMGSLISSYPEYRDQLNEDSGFFDLSFIPAKADSRCSTVETRTPFLTSVVDRLVSPT